MSTATAPTLVGYVRVSTQKQGDSGLGLEAQTAALESYARSLGATFARIYREVESGKKTEADRPELQKAIAHAKRSRGRLVIAKLDRLARNVPFTARLVESKVDFVACDNPHANTMTIYILAAVAEDEARRIGERTRAALAAYKARGGLLGAARPEGKRLTPELAAKGRARAAAAHAAAATAAYADLVPLLLELHARGWSCQAIARRLNADGHTTRRGLAWSRTQVGRVLNRALRLRREIPN